MPRACCTCRWRQQRLSQKSKREQEQQRKAMLEDEAFGKDQRQLQRQLMGGLYTLQKITLLLGVPAHTFNGELESQQVTTTRR